MESTAINVQYFNGVNDKLLYTEQAQLNPNMNVEELIQKKKLVYRQQGADFVVHCLNPEHDDSNPSMRIDRITGIFHCFSCGFKGNVFKYFDDPVSFLEQKRAK